GVGLARGRGRGPRLAPALGRRERPHDAAAPAGARRDRLLARAAPRRLRRLQPAAVTRHDPVELRQRLDLVDDDAPHLRRAVGRLLRQLEDALAYLLAGRLQLPLHLAGHVLEIAHQFAELVRRLLEQRHGLAGRLLVDVAQRLARALALRFRGRAHQLVLAGDRARPFGARLGDHAGDV